MKIKLTLKQKILLLVIGFSFVVYTIAIGYISLMARKAAFNDAITVTNTTAQKYTSDIKSLLEKDLIVMRTLSQSVLSYKLMPEEEWKRVFAKMYEEVIKENPLFLAVWDSWELSHIDPTYEKDYGRYVAEYWREGQQIKSNFSFKSMNGDPLEYARLKREAKESIENPYFYSYTGNEFDQQLMTSLISPIIDNGKYIGVVGVDITLERYHPIILQIKPFDGSYAFLISNDLHYAAHPYKEKLGENILTDYETILDKYDAIEKIKNGEEHSFVANDINGVKSYFTFSPIIVGKTKMPWSLAIIVPHKTILAQANKNFIISIIVGIIGLVLLSSLIFFGSRIIIDPILALTSSLKRIAKGHVSDDVKLKIKSSDEIGEMAEALNVSIDGLKQKVDFATKIGKGDLNSDFEILGKEDSLGSALINMRKSLKEAHEEEEKRKKDDMKRRWANEGYAKFAEILRQNNDDLHVLSRSIVKELVHYLDANQGGLFLYNDDDKDNPIFELYAAFAYNRFKYNQKHVLVGEGLIGASYLEKKTIYLTEIPEGYIEITSGLGGSNPKSLLIVPLLIEEQVLGVIEIASFNEIEDYQIEFVERVAQSIGSTVISVKVNIRTSQLLAKTQQQAEEMSAQEEEMRQNMEELQATQEESMRKSAEMQSFIDALNNSSFVIEYDPLGYITAINNAYLELLGLTRDEVVGTHHSGKLDMSPEKKREYDQFWNDLRNGIPHKQINKFIVNNKSFVFQETYTPIKDEQGDVYKILKISNNITNLVAD